MEIYTFLTSGLKPASHSTYFTLLEKILGVSGHDNEEQVSAHARRLNVVKLVASHVIATVIPGEVYYHMPQMFTHVNLVHKKVKQIHM
jgi:hypothetical protein